jgi:tripartite-type tricarboxylate transporter receptor subunit TctC
MKLLQLLVAGCLAVFGLAGTDAAVAQGWPTAKPITMVVPFPPGPLDLIARLVGGKVGDALGQTVVVENRAGANGTIGSNLVARAAPDGYTLLAATAGTHVTAVHLLKSLPYDPIKDFTPLAAAVEPVTCLVVHAALPVNSVPELIDYAKQRPGELAYGTSGVGSVFHMMGELFNQTAGVKINHVPYRGGAQAITDLLANEIVFMFYPYAALLPHIKAGALRALGTTAKIAALPDVPTLAEAKLADFEINAWFGVFAPAKTPKPIIDKLNAKMAGVITDPGIKEKLIQQGIDPVYGTPEELAALQKVDLDKWRTAVEAAGAKLD